MNRFNLLRIFILFAFFFYISEHQPYRHHGQPPFNAFFYVHVLQSFTFWGGGFHNKTNPVI